MKKEFKVPYTGTTKIFHLDEEHLLYHLEPSLPARPTLEEELEKVKAALNNPIGSNKISDLLKTGDKVVLLVDDWTRNTPVHKIVPIVLEEILKSGIKEDDIKIIIAKGKHAKLSEEQFRKKLGAEIVEKFHVENHDPDGNLVHVGTSKMGTPVMVNRNVMEADRKFAIGGILAHPVFGYGGGAKIILPGISSRETINTNHSMGDHRNATMGIADGNPCRNDAEDIARMVGLDFIINVIMNPENEIIGAVAGDVVETHRAGIRIYDRMYAARIGEEADIVVLGANPRDATIGHGTFALPCAVPFIKEEGTIIWVAACLSGPYSREERFKRQKMWASSTPEELMKTIKDKSLVRSPSIPTIFTWNTSRVIHRNKVVLVSDNISQKEAEEFGFHYGETIQTALDRAIKGEDDAKVTVISSGGVTVPVRI
jgi:nickel-dependent lactate racemase